mmetsp:Transcript_31562/g.52656  ORF Transcript_31562/g.52656 Transcript_31562/m.52656 type:complete len:197 (+) Transcript_31562:159-749(+)
MTDSTAADAPAEAVSKRDSLNGCWKLDRNRGQGSMRGYLETLNVPELAIQAHEKGETETATYHTIELSPDHQKVKITKRSRVNNDLVVELTLGEQRVEYLQPDDRPKKQLATTEDPGKHLKIESSLLTVNGMAHVTDIKRIVEEQDGSVVLVQELKITNPQTGNSNMTTRYFIPHDGPIDGETTGEETGEDKMDME